MSKSYKDYVKGRILQGVVAFLTSCLLLYLKYVFYYAHLWIHAFIIALVTGLIVSRFQPMRLTYASLLGAVLTVALTFAITMISVFNK